MVVPGADRAVAVTGVRARGAAVWRVLGHAAVWAALYSGACTLMVAQLAIGERDPGEGPVLFAALTGLGVYLLDRAKLSDRALDPADAEAQPARYAFVRRWAGVLRVSAVACLIGASALGVLIEWALVAAPWVGAIVVLFYGGGLAWPRGRLKRWLVVKNLVVAVGLTGFAAVAAGIERFLDLGVLPLGEGLAVVMLVVFADAVLCDIADAESDLDAGTRTIPAIFGGRAAWGVALALEVAALGVGVVVGRAAWAWTVPIVVTTPVLMCLPTRVVRDLVDVRLAAVAVVAWAVWG